MAQRFIKPVEKGAHIPRPDQFFRPLAENGEWVPDSSYYRRRLQEGSCVEVEQVQPIEDTKQGDEQ